MSESNQERNVEARIIRQVQVLQTENPKIAVVRIQTTKSEDHFCLTRQALIDMANLFLKNAERFEPEDNSAPSQTH